jgi:phosphotransferase system HPr-like phosphotransfer protein
MAVTATPTFSPNGGQAAPASTFTISCATASSTIRYTYGDAGANTGWTTYTGAVSLPSASGNTVTVRAYATSAGNDDSAVASATFYTVGYSSAVSATAKTVIDTAASQGLAAVCEGIAPSGADGASISGWRIGASATTTDLKVETNA